MVLEGYYDWVMVGVLLAEGSDLFNGLFEIDWFAEGFVLEGVVDDGNVAIVVNIHFHALYSVL